MLDLFCGAGGAGEGYYRAGFEVIGIDIKPQPNYPLEFRQADAMDVLANLELGEFAAIHASPPCQAYSVAKNIGGRLDHPDLVGPVRERLIALGVPWVIENVPGAPLIDPITLCGLTFGLNVKRHRLFESNVAIAPPPVCPKGHPGDWVTVFGGGAPKLPDNRRRAPADAARVAMGIDWMTRSELSQAIPPAYTHYVGFHLRAALLTRSESVA